MDSAFSTCILAFLPHCCHILPCCNKVQLRNHRAHQEEQTMLEFADQEKHTMARQSKGRADRRHCETEDSASSRKSMFIRYSKPAQDVIQRKQTAPLADRLREQGIDPRAFGPDFARLTREYDALPNTAPQRAAQQRHLHVLLDLLAERINAGEKNPRLQTALNLIWFRP